MSIEKIHVPGLSAAIAKRGVPLAAHPERCRSGCTGAALSGQWRGLKGAGARVALGHALLMLKARKCAACSTTGLIAI